MLTNATQDTRELAVITPAGKDKLLLQSFQGREEMSRLFEFQLEMLSADDDIDPKQLVGHNVTLMVDQQTDPVYFNGFVSEFLYVNQNDLGVVYRATVVPWLWFLKNTTDCRIFQNKSVPEIIEEVFQDLGFRDFETNQLTQNYPPLEYCVQYRETDFNFVSRLMEEYGIFYFFQHESGKHTLVMADNKAAHEEVAEGPVAVTDPEDPEELERQVTSWRHLYGFRPGAWAQTDYNFKQPSTNLLSSETTLVDWKDNKQFELYDYPGRFEDTGLGRSLTRVRMEEQETPHDRVTGDGSYRTFSPGSKFKINSHVKRSEVGNSFTLTIVTHTASVGDSYRANKTSSDGYVYTNRFEAIPHETTFRPARTTRRPIVEGPQTAIVVGPSGQEIYVDEHARVKVQFYWDRYGQRDENSSCWIRVSNPWAGKFFGGMNIPRIGQEVIVSFLEGDPDRPIISGRVYNGEQVPYPSNAGRAIPGADGAPKYPGNQRPSDIPQAAMMTSLKSNSLGGSGGFNEITMNDTGGEEGLFFKAQKDEVHVVGHDREDAVVNNESRKVGVDRTRKVGNNELVAVGQNQRIAIGNNKGVTVAKNHAEVVGENQSTTVGKVQANTVGKAIVEKVGVASVETVGVARVVMVGYKLVTAVGGGMTTAVGKDSTEKVGGTKTINAGDKFEIICGDSKLVMDKSGKILLEGKDILIKGSGKIVAKASGDMVLKGAKIGEN